MRFNATDHNLELMIDSRALEQVVLAVTDVLVPRWTKKLRFCSHTDRNCAALRERATAKGDLTVVDPEDHRQVVQHWRAVWHEEQGVLYVAAFPETPTRKDWKSISQKVQQRLERRT